MFWNNINLSLLTEFCIKKIAVGVLISQAVRLSQPPWPDSILPSLNPYLLSGTWPSLGLTPDNHTCELTEIKNKIVITRKWMGNGGGDISQITQTKFDYRSEFNRAIIQHSDYA